MSEYFKKPMTADDWHGDTPVAYIGITLYRSGVMKMEGSITDEKFVQYMLDTAKDTMRSYHAQFSIAALVGAAIVFTFPRGIVLAGGGAALVAWNITTNSAAVDIHAVADE